MICDWCHWWWRSTTMDEWAACVDAITFIFQARTTPINNEKEREMKREWERKPRVRGRDIYTCTLLVLITARVNLWACVCVCMVNEWDVWGLSKLTQTYISSDRFTTLYKAFCYNKITRPMGYNVAQPMFMWVRAYLTRIIIFSNEFKLEDIGYEEIKFSVQWW
jgi:hypothetical protein